MTLLRLLMISLPLNFAWEMLQMPAFAGLPANRLAAAGVCALAALGDALIVLAMYGFGAYVFREPDWFTPPSVRRYAIVVTTGLLLHVLVEWIAVRRWALWSYRDIQPILPGLKLGILPILQPLILLPVTFRLLAWAHACFPRRWPLTR